ncbi:MAG: hypothetical protein KatS3mg115_1707 [Candidatus Poribacteria bacterium]|nr:MAG: hypothetical protein KatS3mg115_1707 [Candidatus Poribacteria bacterium]
MSNGAQTTAQAVVVWKTQSPEETERLGEQIAEQLRAGDVLALVGDLGAGKTCLVRGIARGLGSKDRVTSPTFVLLQRYDGGRLPLYHLDFYRLSGPEEAADLAPEEVFEAGGVAVVEWADRAPTVIPQRAVWLRIEIEGESTRRIALFGDSRFADLDLGSRTP